MVEARRAADDGIHRRVDELLANGQRELLTGLIDLLCRQGGGTNGNGTTATRT